MLSKAEITQLEHIHPLAVHKHIVRHFHKHAHKYVHAAQHLHHVFIHCGELILVLIMGMSGIMFANFSSSLDWLERTSSTEIATYLAQAIAHPENILKNWNLISIWTVDDSVENTFTKWYCTYGAARISPEFFPFTDETKLTQQRTRGGNAVDRCANAAATGYRVGNTPAPWALVVYNAGGRFGQYGHVGKVMYYSKWLNKIIVRDMAWVSMFTMSDRRDDLATANVECYIYNVRDSVVWPISTGNLTAIATWTTQTQTWTNNNIHTPVVVPVTPTTPPTPVTNPNTVITTTPVVITPKPATPSTEPVVQPVTPVVTTPPVVTPPVVPEKPVVNNTVSDKDITLNFDNISDSLVQHYVGFRDISADLSSKTTMHVGDEAVLTITIKDKKTQTNIDGLLPTVLEFIASNNNIDVDYFSVRLISDGKVEVHIKALQAGKSSLVINLGVEKIGRIGFSIE